MASFALALAAVRGHCCVDPTEHVRTSCRATRLDGGGQDNRRATGEATPVVETLSTWCTKPPARALTLGTLIARAATGWIPARHRASAATLRGRPPAVSTLISLASAASSVTLLSEGEGWPGTQSDVVWSIPSVACGRAGIWTTNGPSKRLRRPPDRQNKNVWRPLPRSLTTKFVERSWTSRARVAVSQKSKPSLRSSSIGSAAFPPK
jgi:hypothetical protein